MPRFVAASISITSTARPSRTSTHESHVPQGSATGFSAERQFSAIADARDGRFADAAVSAKNVAVRDAALFQRVLERARDVRLPNHVGKALRAILARQDQISHEEGSL